LISSGAAEPSFRFFLKPLEVKPSLSELASRSPIAATTCGMTPSRPVQIAPATNPSVESDGLGCGETAPGTIFRLALYRDTSTRNPRRSIQLELARSDSGRECAAMYHAHDHFLFHGAALLTATTHGIILLRGVGWQVISRPLNPPSLYFSPNMSSIALLFSTLAIVLQVGEVKHLLMISIRWDVCNSCSTNLFGNC
jgi:hypothetical protein